MNRHDLEQRARLTALAIDRVTTPGTLDRLWTRIHEARRGYPSGHEPPAPTTTTDEDGNPTSTAVGYSDRTGELATRGHDQVETDLDHLDHTTRELVRHATHLLDLLDRYARPAPTVTYCVSCKRDAGHREPVATGRYTDACRWCGDWRNLNKAWPPMEILRAHRCGQRITQQMLDRHHVRTPRRANA